MIDLGTVLPGSTVYIPVNTFDSNDPSASVTATDWSNTDCHVHKDGGTTQRASSAGETLSLNFDGITGNHLLAIDLADNTTANFYEAGSVYHVRIEGVTVDAGTINAWIGMFRIGYPGAILDTTIATLAGQTSFTLEDGSADDDAYNGMPCIIHDLASAVQVAKGIISDYTGASKTVTLDADPGVFTMAAGDNISIFIGDALNPTARGNLETAADNYSATRGLSGTALPAAAADSAGGLPISDAGGLDLDAMNTNINDIETDTADMQPRVAAIETDTNELQGDWTNGGRLDLIIDELTTNVDAVETDTQDIQSRLPAALVNSRMDSTIDGTGMESGAITAIWTTALTEAYRSTGATGTAAQLLYEIMAHLGEHAISGTTKTTKKLDGSTTAKTYTLDDATSPTSITETM